MRSFIHSSGQRGLKGSSFSITSERVVREHLGLHQLLLLTLKHPFREMVVTVSKMSKKAGGCDLEQGDHGLTHTRA